MHPAPSQGKERICASRSSVLPLIVLLFGITMMVLGCGGQLVTYVDPDYGFAFDYNDTWDLIEVAPANLPSDADKSVGVFDPQGSDAGNDLTFDYLSVDVYEVEAGAIPTIDELGEGFSSYVERLEASDDSLEVVDAVRTTIVNDMTALKVTYTYRANETDVRCSEYRVVDNTGVVYSLFIQASEDYWDRNDEIFGTFLDSFSLGADT